MILMFNIASGATLQTPFFNFCDPFQKILEPPLVKLL